MRPVLGSGFLSLLMDEYFIDGPFADRMGCKKVPIVYSPGKVEKKTEVEITSFLSDQSKRE